MQEEHWIQTTSLPVSRTMYAYLGGVPMSMREKYSLLPKARMEMIELLNPRPRPPPPPCLETTRERKESTCSASC